MAKSKSIVTGRDHLTHRAALEFWSAYRILSPDIRLRADKQFALLKADPQHPSLRFKKLHDRGSQEIWSARITLDYRALAFKHPESFLWFWIGPHKAYDAII